MGHGSAVVEVVAFTRLVAAVVVDELLGLAVPAVDVGVELTTG